MTNEEIIKNLKSYEEEYQSGIDDDSSFAFFTIDELSTLDMSEYNIFELFSRNTIEDSILKFGTDLIIAELNDQRIERLMCAYPGGVKVINYSSKMPLFKRLFDDWQKKGWVIINQDIENKKQLHKNLNFDLSNNQMDILNPISKSKL